MGLKNVNKLCKIYLQEKQRRTSKKMTNAETVDTVKRESYILEKIKIALFGNLIHALTIV